MAKLNPRLLSEVKKADPSLDESLIYALLPTELPLDAPTGKSRLISAFCTDALRVYTEGKLVREVQMRDIERFYITNGVGCIFVEYEEKGSGERILFARADNRFTGMAGQCIKRANHVLRFGNTDFSRLDRFGGQSCPRCGKPYPKGMHTCPRCASKKKVVRRLAALARPELRYILMGVLLFFVTTGFSVIIPYINRVMVDDYIRAEGNPFLWAFVGVVLSLLAVNAARRLISIARGYFLTVAGNNLIVRLRNTVFEKIQQLSVERISKRTSGELMKRVNGDTRVINQFIVNRLPNVLEQGLILVAIAAVLFFYDWRLALLILLPTPIVVLCFRMFWRFMHGMFRRRWDLNSRANAVLHDIFSGIRVVKSYGMEKREEERYLEISGKERDAQLRQERLWALLMPLLQFMMGFGEFILLYYVGSKMLAGSMTAGEMSQFSAYAGMIFGPLNALMVFPRQFMEMMTSVTRVYEIMDEEIDIAENDKKRLGDVKGYIDIDHISFGYDDADEVLRDIDLHIRPGEFIGLVGKSGVGKSTLINLIMRMYDVHEGAIRIDGVDIRDISQESLRSFMGVVLQENFLFTGSVWQNISYAKPDATREEVVQAAKAAGAHEFIIRLPDGYNTYIGEKGHTLSGGERQRISIARALLHDPKILILDEATASLDTETEKLIQDALLELSHGRTTIAIAHRLSTLRNANRLVVMDKGQIAEIGSHDELMEKRGIYYGLVMAQRDMSKMEA